jgi:2-polyprenyl-3-methyl-5-hydroxy-6-metoxy-1,4-benzoquinol methylase
VTDSIRLEDVPCPLGCPKDDDVILTGHDYLHNLPGEFTVVKCRACGLMRTNPRPTPEAMGFYYPDDYGPYLSTAVKKNDAMAALKARIIDMLRSLIPTNGTRLPKMAPGRMLEIGCASGSFMHRMAGRGWNVEGVEFSKKAAQAAEQLGYRVYVGSLESVRPSGEPFDLIVGWMVLEHLHDPVGGLKKILEWAKPGAWLVLSVPNVESLGFRLFKEKWFALHLPNHLYHLAPRSLERLLQVSGWKLERVLRQRTLINLFGSVGNVLQDKGCPVLGRRFREFASSVWLHLFFPLAWLRSLFGHSGCVTVWARKSPGNSAG